MIETVSRLRRSFKFVSLLRYLLVTLLVSMARASVHTSRENQRRQLDNLLRTEICSVDSNALKAHVHPSSFARLSFCLSGLIC